MKKSAVIIALFFAFSTPVLAAADFCLSGAGTGVVNGAYTQESSTVWRNADDIVVIVDDVLHCSIHLHDINGTAYYYDDFCAGNPLNANWLPQPDGSLPSPSVTVGDCPVPPTGGGMDSTFVVGQTGNMTSVVSSALTGGVPYILGVFAALVGLGIGLVFVSQWVGSSGVSPVSEHRNSFGVTDSEQAKIEADVRSRLS